MRFKKGAWVVYHEPPRTAGSRKLVGRVTESNESYAWVDWLGEPFPVIGWAHERLQPASVVDVLASVAKA